ncbi:GNAT family N-acetyltransferase [Streptomyces sp. NPDC006739]|uniref:GNAT family N-acetyltransferase n=1 Tax=Streptomyces sp. NPDC006739 TaxID=3364763 RepID=UPI0036A262AD
MTPAEYPEWLTSKKAAYVGDIVRAGALSPEEAVRKSDQDFAKLIPNGLATPGNTFLVLEAAGEQIGTGWLKHGYLPEVTYGYSLYIEDQHRGKGYGRAAMTVGEQATLAAGDSTLMVTVGRQRGGDEPLHERRLPSRGGQPVRRPSPLRGLTRLTTDGRTAVRPACHAQETGATAPRSAVQWGQVGQAGVEHDPVDGLVQGALGADDGFDAAGQ